jgi:hypothetical protein
VATVSKQEASDRHANLARRLGRKPAAPDGSWTGVRRLISARAQKRR